MTDDGNISDFFEVCYLIVMHRQYRMVLGLGLRAPLLGLGLGLGFRKGWG